MTRDPVITQGHTWYPVIINGHLWFVCYPGNHTRVIQLFKRCLNSHNCHPAFDLSKLNYDTSFKLYQTWWYLEAKWNRSLKSIGWVCFGKVDFKCCSNLSSFSTTVCANEGVKIKEIVNKINKNNFIFKTNMFNIVVRLSTKK